ncbi:DUF6012 family protein [Pseudomonas aeruginosa]|uniref:DUF6012 family protein n=1 Tax=Pseudomonas aeruginosa TaxID=287 RepID=UPI0009402554|nr:DUF6012 family protein [Pseudomonas aeruginosa]MDS9914910.1 DUF6012 family protein [Pseudomonas aeruginosa]
MLIHVTPKIYAGRNNRSVDVSLVDLKIPEFGLSLRGGEHLVGRKPYPNKFYTVACRKQGREAVEGLFFEVGGRVKDFTVITRWALQAEMVVQHVVKYHVLDEDFDTVTDSMVLWHGRWPESAKDCTPASHQPRMDVFSDNGRKGDFRDTVNSSGIVLERHETFRIPTIEKERLERQNSLSNRLPHFDSAIRV